MAITRTTAVKGKMRRHLTTIGPEASKHSATGNRTRVARVRAEYPNQLDYSGFCHPDPPKQTHNKVILEVKLRCNKATQGGLEPP